MQCLPFHNDEQSDSGHNHTLDADAELGGWSGTKASLSTSTFANSILGHPPFRRNHLINTLHPPPRNELPGGFQVETDARESWMVELASKQQDYKVASLAVKKQKMEIAGIWSMRKNTLC